MIRFLLSFLDIFLFSLPIIAGQIGHMLFGVGDTIIIGHYSTTALAALGIATAILVPLKIVGLGITYVISPSKAEKLARGEDISAYPATSTVLAIITGTVLTLLVLAVSSSIHLIGLDPEIANKVAVYLRITAASMIPAIVFQAVKENLQAYEKTVFANGVIIFVNLINIALNILFIFGLNMGIAGAAAATTISQLLMALILLVHAVRVIPFRWNCSGILLAELFRKGVPAGLSGVVTALVFSLVTVLSGKMGIIVSAANNIIIIISSVTFMVPYALSCAVSVKVGQKMGEKAYGDLALYGGAAVLLGLLSAGSMVILFLALPEQLLRLMSGDSAVIAYGTLLLFAVAIYQIPDSVMCITMGALRGMGITFSPMVWNIIGIWGVGFPLGCYLAYGKGMQAVGLWYGLVVGLSFSAVVFAFIFVKQLIGYGVGRRFFRPVAAIPEPQ